MSLADCNTLTSLICCIDAYVWLLLYYLYANLYKGEKFMGNVMPPFWGKMQNEIEAEIKRLDEKIEKCDNEKKISKYRERKAEYEKMLADTSDEK